MKLYIAAFLFFVFFAPTVTHAQNLDEHAYVKAAQTWLNNLDTAQARFEQIDYRGNSLNGNFYINRPGRLRFEYDTIDDFIVADGVQIHFYDDNSGQVNSGPIGSTLADFILRDRNRFGDNVNVEDIDEDSNFAYITVSQAGQPGMGTLTLNFTKQPWRLHSWKITDAQGLTTTLILRNYERDIRIPPSYFTIDNRNLNE